MWAGPETDINTHTTRKTDMETNGLKGADNTTGIYDLKVSFDVDFGMSLIP